MREKDAVRRDETGTPPVTIYRVRELYREHTLVELELKTGRTHQIRVHLSHLGYPIVADDMYGGRVVRAGDLGCARAEGAGEVVMDRVALHAALLGLRHPITGAPMSVQAPLPQDLRGLVLALREHAQPEPVHVPGVLLDLDAMVGRP